MVLDYYLRSGMVEFNKDRVTTLKIEDMQNQSMLVFSIRSTLGKIETILQIGEALEKLCKKCNIKS